MELSIHLECPQCNTALSLPFKELAPGRRQQCHRCQAPVRLTTGGLERLAQDLRCYCEG